MVYWDPFLHYRAGSTIADYSVRAPAFNNAEIENVKTGIFADLGEKYPMIYESKTVLHIFENNLRAFFIIVILPSFAISGKSL